MRRRWWIIALLFLSTVLNYVDRQTLSVLVHTIQTDLHFSDMDYSKVMQGFLLAYTVAYLVVGRAALCANQSLSLAADVRQDAERSCLVFLSVLVSKVFDGRARANARAGRQDCLDRLPCGRPGKRRWRMVFGPANPAGHETGRGAPARYDDCSADRACRMFDRRRCAVPAVLALAAVVTFAHLTWQVTMGALIVDLYPKNMMATAFGFIAAGSGFGGMLSTGAIGWLVTHISYRPVFLLMALLHPLALLLARRVAKHGSAIPCGYRLTSS